MNYALSAYPVSQSFSEKLKSLTGESIKFFLLSELRAKSPVELWLFLRALRPNRFFLLLEDQSSHVLLPILQIVAKISKPKEMVVVNAEHHLQKLKSREVVQAVIALTQATAIVRFSYFLARNKLQNLLENKPLTKKIKFADVKNVLYLNANLWFGVKAGGSVGHIAGVANALVNRGLAVDYAGVDKSSVLSKVINHIKLPVFKTFGMPAELNGYHFNNKVIAFLLRKKHHSNWDFIYQRMSTANFAGVVVARALNIPLVLEYNGSEAWVAKNWGKQLRYHDTAVMAEDVCLKHADIVVTISDVLKEELITKGVSSEKIVCYPNCIDPLLFNPENFSIENNSNLRSKYNIAKDALVFTFVGTFGQWHGVDILAQAIHRLIKEHENWLQANKVHFLLVGDGVKMSEVQRILGDCINTSYVTLTGLIPQAEAPAYLSASDVLLSPHVANADGSRFFGSPTKLFEYMAMGKAIIASDLEQIGAVLNHSLRAEALPTSHLNSSNKELGILCEPGNVSHLLEAMQFIVKDSKGREILGRNAREEALAKYTWEKNVDVFLSKKI